MGLPLPVFFTFIVLQLTDEERVYLNAAALGDVPIIRQSLEETNEISLNVNCLDYMGRSALHLAVDSESMEAVELLLDRINFECIEESLLHAISKGATKIVKVGNLFYEFVANAACHFSNLRATKVWLVATHPVRFLHHAIVSYRRYFFLFE